MFGHGAGSGFVCVTMDTVCKADGEEGVGMVILVVVSCMLSGGSWSLDDTIAMTSERCTSAEFRVLGR